MKTIVRLLIVLIGIIIFNTCSDNQVDSSSLTGVSVDADITVEGGTLSVSDEYGNVINVTFPPGAVLETIHASLAIASEDIILPIAERQTPVFEIRPTDISLYKPVAITIEYNTALNEIEKAGLFRVCTESWLTPLSDHTYTDDNKSMTATTLFLGDFAEGKMTLDQLNTQFNLLVASLDITWNSVNKPLIGTSQVSCDTKIHKATWDDWKSKIGAFIFIFSKQNVLGYYNETQTTFLEDMGWLCTNVVNVAVKTVLDQCIPDDLCDKNYTHTITNMVAEMKILGCTQDNSIYDLLQERFNKMLNDCSSYLKITSELNIGSGVLAISTIGAIPITLIATGNNTAIVEGYGTLELSGGGGYGDVCFSTVSGVTLVDVFGTKDADNTYVLVLTSEQNGLVTTICPDDPTTYEPGDGGSTTYTPLVGSDTREVTLSSANGYTQEFEEPVEGGGTFIMDVTLVSPHTGDFGK